jgi:hypothetical protein
MLFPTSNRRGETAMAGLTMHLFGYIFNRIFTEINRRGPRYFGVVWTQTFGTFSHPLNIAWMSLACDDSEERALAMAMYVFFPPILSFLRSLFALLTSANSSGGFFSVPSPFPKPRVIMGANIAGIYGAQIFRQDDRPRYRRGFGINIAVLSVGLTMALFRFLDDLRRRRRSAGQVQTKWPSKRDWQEKGEAAVVPPSDVQPQTLLVDNDARHVIVSDPAK